LPARRSAYNSTRASAVYAGIPAAMGRQIVLRRDVTCSCAINSRLVGVESEVRRPLTARLPQKRGRAILATPSGSAACHHMGESAAKIDSVARKEAPAQALPGPSPATALIARPGCCTASKSAHGCRLVRRSPSVLNGCPSASRVWAGLWILRTIDQQRHRSVESCPAHI
jgi:hypothetical protein